MCHNSNNDILCGTTTLWDWPTFDNAALTSGNPSLIAIPISMFPLGINEFETSCFWGHVHGAYSLGL